MTPPAPGLLTTTIGVGISPRSCIIFWTTRAVLSLPPPLPAPTINSTFFDGFQLCANAGVAPQIVAASTMLMQNNLLLTLILPSRKGRTPGSIGVYLFKHCAQLRGSSTRRLVGGPCT